ncbi:ATP-binding cassette domain-containing protein [Pseudoalteromonas sp. APAL1]|uniref:ATP-binding cassette domain-containing protein n=1 Tax=Pseudoalteromonas sp. APAL1 TaxID=2908883 RepID=UPI002E22B4C3
MIAINNLNKRFASAHVFENYNKQLQGKRVCLQAANGRGKTTLLMMLAGLEEPQSGQILYNNEALKSPQNDVSIASDRIVLPDFLTARQIIELSCKAYQSSSLQVLTLQSISTLASVLYRVETKRNASLLLLF